MIPTESKDVLLKLLEWGWQVALYVEVVNSED